MTGPLRKVPGPLYARFTSLPLKWATLTGRRIFFVDKLHRHYGDMVVIAPDQVNCNSPSMLREIHRHGNGFRKTRWYVKFGGFPDVDERQSVFTILDTVIHAARRKLMGRAFSKSEIRKHWEKAIKGKVDFAVKQMGAAADIHPDGEVDVQKWWTLMTADVSSMVSFGQPFDLLSMGEKNDYLRAVEAISKVDGILAELPLLELLKYVPIPALQRLFSIHDSVGEFAATTASNSVKQAAGDTGSIFSRILAEGEKSGNQLSDLMMGREARSLIIAGTDTTAITLTYLVWAVLSQPQLHQDLLAELHREAAQANGGSDGDFRFTDEQLEKLPLLTATVQECLRLYGAAPGGLPRNPPPGGATVGGVYLPESVIVSTQAWSLHRHPDIWEDPEKFDVSRWLSASGLSESAKIAFNPFGGGARICLGLHIAEIELRYGAAMFFWRYPKARLAPGTTAESMAPENFFIIAPKAHECRVVLQ
ncbi:Cytochrome P450 [Macrophomina phaseolina MS6]|uniref:Cytochrome P450 n=1 Tax=Macrophomina phaseolina (strain MS6) TaxID=1126212 RepID=K2QS16_MACPH|nr:Cytochrome P450 [Macrophomina phaseolina MS6]